MRAPFPGHPLGVLNETTPSIRSFAQAIDRQRQGVERIPILSSERADLVEAARALDEAEVAAIAVAVEPGPLGLGRLREAARAVSVPVLRADPLVAEVQVYESRIAGADAVLLEAGALSDELLARLCDVARSTHMAALVTCRDEGEVRRASLARAPILVLRNQGLFASAPRRTLLLADSAQDPSVESLRGKADALLDRTLGAHADPAAAFALALTQDEKE